VELEEKLKQEPKGIARIPVLLDLAYQLHQEQPQRSFELGEEAYTLALDYDDILYQAEALYRKGIALDILGEYPKAVEHLERARDLFAQGGDVAKQHHANHSLAIILKRMGQVSKALELSYENLSYFRKIKDTLKEASILTTIAVSYKELGDYDKALELTHSSLELMRSLGEKKKESVVLNNLANIYKHLGKLEEAIHYYNQSCLLSREIEYAWGEGLALSNSGMLWLELGEYAKALECETRALEILERIGDKAQSYLTLHNIARIKEAEGEYSFALEYLEKAILYARECKAKRYEILYSLSIASIYLKQGRGDEAVSLTMSLMPLAEEAHSIEFLMEAHRLLSSCYEVLHQHEEALCHYKRYIEYEKKLKGEEMQKAASSLQMRYDLERTQKEKEIYRLKSEQLENELTLQEKELTLLSLYLSKKNELLESLHTSVAALMENGSSNEKIQGLFDLLNASHTSDSERQVFEDKFALVHSDFLTHLSRLCKQLTPTELKLCALIRMNMANKEISQLLNISLRAVETYRYRVRTKLGLDSTMNLTTYLTSLI